MGPKVRAATRFVRDGGQVAVITTARLVGRDAGQHRPGGRRHVGTRIVRPDGRQGVSSHDRGRSSSSRTPTSTRSCSSAACGRCARSTASSGRARPWRRRRTSRRCRPKASPDRRRTPRPTTSSSWSGRRRRRPRRGPRRRRGRRPSSRPGPTAAIAASPTPRSLREAVRAQPGSQRRGDLGARRLRRAGCLPGARPDLHVLLFSDNVPVDKEIALKDYAPSTRPAVDGTGRRHGDARGRRSRLRQRRHARAASASSRPRAPARRRQCPCSTAGAWASARSSASAGATCPSEVGGRMALSAIAALREDPATEVILFVSKPPAPEVAAAVLATAGETPWSPR